MTKSPTLLLLCVVCLWGVVVSGCRDAGSLEPTYRTIVANPLADPQRAQLHNKQGLERMAQGDLDAAQRAFEKALTADRQFGPAHNNLGKVFYKKGLLQKAAYEFDLAIECMPDHPAPYNNLGLVEEDGPKPGRAIELYRKACQRAPDQVRYKANLARALSKQGLRERELKELLEAIVAEDDRKAWVQWARGELAEHYGLGR
jgi:tetratricopeptide (TPR) repeat protein